MSLFQSVQGLLRNPRQADTAGDLAGATFQPVRGLVRDLIPHEARRRRGLLVCFNLSGVFCETPPRMVRRCWPSASPFQTVRGLLRDPTSTWRCVVKASKSFQPVRGSLTRPHVASPARTCGQTSCFNLSGGLLRDPTRLFDTQGPEGAFVFQSDRDLLRDPTRHRAEREGLQGPHVSI